jgi:uncharacterized protein YjaG (DUF416 family)
MVMIGVMVVAVWNIAVAGGTDDEMQLYCTLAAALLLTWGVYYTLSYAIDRDAAWVASVRDALRRYSLSRTMVIKQLKKILNDKT